MVRVILNGICLSHPIFFMRSCHTQTQRPVYGFPPGQAPVMMAAPMAQPVYAPPPPMAQPKEVV